MPDRDPLQSLWRSAAEAPFSMSPADLRDRATALQRTVRLRNWSEYISAIFVVGVFVYTAIISPSPLLQIGALLIAAGAVFVAWKLHAIGRAASDGEMSAGAASWADFYREELRRQRDAVASVPIWYLGPFVPGMVVFVLGVAFAPPGNVPFVARLAICVIAWLIVAIVFAGIAWLNARAAKALQREIDALDRARQS